jgi:hypothetical protein
MKGNELHRTLLFLAIAAYLAMASLSAWTLLPGCDEAWFTLPGYNLVTNGHFGTTVLDESARFRQVRLDGINERTYWIMPSYPVLQGVLGKLFGFGLFTTRSASVFFGLVALIATYMFTRSLSDNRAIPLIAAGLLAADPFFVFGAGFGRMDMMAFALGLGSLTAYVGLREKHLSLAAAISSMLCAVSSFTHPLGLMWAVSLVFVALYLDLKNVRPRHAALAAVPFIVLAAAWGIYIARDPATFAVQFGGNASDRWAFFASPVRELGREIFVRYFSNFGITDGLIGAAVVKVIPLAVLLASLVVALAVKQLRSQRSVRILLALAAQQFVMIMLLDSMKQGYYLLHIIPTLVMITAAAAGWAIARGTLARYVAIAACLAFLGVNVLTNLSRFRRDHLHNDFLPAVAVIDRETAQGETVFASAEFWLAVERPEQIVDDFRLGIISGRRADLIVLDEQRYRSWIGNLASSEPANHAQMIGMLEGGYTSIYRNERFEVLRRKP